MNKKRIYELEEITTHSDGDYIVVDNASYEQAKKISLSNFTEKSEELKLRDERLKYYGDPNIVPSDENLFEFTILNSKEAFVKTSDTNLISGDVVIPYKCNIDGNEYLVTAIDDFAFDYCDKLTSIIIPDSVTSIGDSAFDDCSGLTSITIPNSVTDIGPSAFSGCKNLTSIIIPDSVTSIGDSAFDSCFGLTSINIPDSVTSIRNGAFSGCFSLTNISIPDSVTSIGDSAFNSCSSLTSITIPNSVTTIGDYAFGDCSSLTSITIPDSVTSIGVGVFNSCSSLTSINIPDSVTSIGKSAFRDCSSLTSITLPFVGSSRTASETYDAVFGYIFGDSSSSGTKQCYNNSSSDYYYIPDTLTTVTITDATQIPYGAFYNCSNLTSISIPDSVTSIGSSAFYYCRSLTSITIPDSVTSIGREVFGGCENLTSITIPDSVTSIGDIAFYYCTSLTSITIPDSVTSIGSDVFGGCGSLTSITCAEGSVADRYAKTNGVNVEYTNEVTKGYVDTKESTENKTIIVSADSTDEQYPSAKAVVDYVAEKSEELKLRDERLKYYGDKDVVPSDESYFTVNETGETITGLKDEGKTQTELVIPYKINGVKITELSSDTLGDSILDGNTVIRKVVIPNSVKWIGYGAFFDRTSLTSVNIPNGVIDIGPTAFEGCTSLKSINIPNSVTSIGNKAFYWCTSLTDITIPNGVGGINDETFMGCTSLKSINIPNSGKWIGNGAFSGCTSLKSIDIPSSVTSITWSAFQGCTSLKSINISNGVIDIGPTAFAGCTSLKTINIPSSVTSIDETAFEGCTNLTIYCEQGSYAETFAKENNIPVIYTDIKSEIINNAENISNKVTELSESSTDEQYPSAKAVVDYVAEKSEELKLRDERLKYYGDPNIVPSDENLFEFTILNSKEAFVNTSDRNLISGDVVIPYKCNIDGNEYLVTSISSSAFSGCENLTSITIPNSVTTINMAAFYGCSSLTSITIPNSVTTIDSGAFEDTGNLTIYCSQHSYADTFAQTNRIPVKYTEVIDGLGGFWGLDLPLIKTITLEESVTSVDILSKAEGIELQEFTVLLFIKYLGDAIEANSISNCIVCLRTNGGTSYFGYAYEYSLWKDKNSFAFWHTKIYDNKFALTDLYRGRGTGNGGGIPYMGSQGLADATTAKYSSYTSFGLDAVDNLNIFISSSDVSRGAIIPQGSMIFLLGR